MSADSTDAQNPPPAPTRDRRIAELPEDLVNQIAAGEVIERPASVVKELVENALDAGARRLVVELEDGGRRLIRVVDDGAGIAAEDLPLAVRNHCTSKLKKLDDLFAIQSLGFRGEALASIGSVSQFKLSSRQEGKDGHEIVVEGGKIQPVKAAALPTGTRVEVRNLFFNVPARRKFLKTNRSELNAVTHQLTRLALSRPDVHLTLRHDNKQVLSVPPSDEPRERIARLTTKVIAQEIIAIGPREGKRAKMLLRGYVSPFNITRADLRGQYFFVNGRAIKDPLLISMVKDAYLHLLPPRRKPYAFLWLDLDPQDVDVNVHPTKAEVRFRYSSDVYGLVVSTIKSALSHLAEPPPLLNTAPKARTTDASGAGAPQAAQAPERPPSLPSDNREFRFPSQPVTQDPNFDSLRERFNQLRNPRPENFQGSPVRQSPRVEVGPSPAPVTRPTPDVPGPWSEAPSTASTGTSTGALDSKPNPDRLDIAGFSDQVMPSGRASAVGNVVQLHNCFIVEEGQESIRIIDQHALHERVLYDQIVQRMASGQLETQRLLFPLESELDPGMIIGFHDVHPILQELGFEIDLDVDNVLKVASIPRFVKQEKALQIVLDLLGEKHPSFVDDEVVALDKALINSKAFQTPEGRTLLHTFSASLACKAAIKFGMRLSQAEMISLLASREGIERAYCCPHGRPTTLNLPLGELRRKFGRPS